MENNRLNSGFFQLAEMAKRARIALQGFAQARLRVMFTDKSQEAELRSFARQIARADSVSPEEVFNDLKRKAFKL